ncbi:hypothetical protein EDEG_00788 [Edhazardia aedis USNM 41457]|uniref:BolA protein n=1 Tax=Edhazardia aedis (strain USNM 41457) TaxID=1003232 RepID=J8ZZR0_EDHAE|nr:hypothetical protein EDEG_00788 [Edhazardia aedis USNM 41457]|eukprot:EJW05118.1 hypothetical protein EDEG_00788 [Edhazardia aedis USNM 41457]
MHLVLIIICTSCLQKKFNLTNCVFFCVSCLSSATYFYNFNFFWLCPCSLMENTSLQKKIERCLLNEFKPIICEIINESDAHKNHKFALENTSYETHFKIVLQSENFNGKSIQERHRMVMEAISFAFEEGLHAVKLNLKPTS